LEMTLKSLSRTKRQIGEGLKERRRKVKKKFMNVCCPEKEEKKHRNPR